MEMVLSVSIGLWYVICGIIALCAVNRTYSQKKDKQ